GIPVFIAELYIGQKSQKDAIAAFKTLHHSRTPWQAAGWLGIVSAFLILSFYSVVGGWVLDYEYMSITNAFAGKSDEEVGRVLTNLFADWPRMLSWHFLFMAMTVGIVLGGIRNGIERMIKFMMPTLFVILLLLLFWCMSLDGFWPSIHFL